MLGTRQAGSRIRLHLSFLKYTRANIGNSSLSLQCSQQLFGLSAQSGFLKQFTETVQFSSIFFLFGLFQFSAIGKTAFVRSWNSSYKVRTPYEERP